MHADTPEISLRTDISVCTDDDLEVRRVRVTNRSKTPKSIDLTSYAEVVLSPAPADDAHPAFNKLFVQTEIADEAQSILCHRRPGSGGAPVPWMFHTAVTATSTRGVSYETDSLPIGSASSRGRVCQYV